MIKFSVYGIPVQKGRPRFFSRGKFVSVYTDKKTKKAEEDFKSQAVQFKPTEPIQGAILLDLVFTTIKPKSAKKRIYWVVMPDLDNLIKLVTDALNGIFWIDDRQIIKIIAKKKYGLENMTELEISEVGDDDGNILEG